METLFDKFGGIRPMADHLSEAPSTVQGWKTARRIPAGKQPGVLDKARELDLDVTAHDVVFPLGVEQSNGLAVDTVDALAPSPGKTDEISGAQVAA